MIKKINVIERTFLFCFPYTFLFSLVLFLVTREWDYVLSFILGTATGLLMNSLNYRVMKNLYKNNPEKIKKTQILIYVAKVVFYGVILYITVKSSEWNPYYTFAGIMTYYIVLVPVSIIYSRKSGGDQEDA
ncbi:MAG: ATP synthase subunit I [Candidatus Izemoplasmatales bacterium]